MKQKRLFVSIVMLILLTACGLKGKGTKIEETKAEEQNIEPQQELELGSSINRICELATLKCFYHNVAELEDKPGVMFKYGLFKYGYKKMWLEYDGVVEVGVDADRIRISEPDRQNNIEIHIPKARILSVNTEEGTLKEGISETGFFTEISSTDKAKALQEAQSNMKAEAEADQKLLARAQQNARKLIENYIVCVGEQMGTSYHIHWIED